MALIDVSDLTLDPDFCDSILVIRRETKPNNFGQSVFTERKISAYGSVQSLSDKDIGMLPEGITSMTTRKIITNKELFPMNANGTNDKVIWKKSTYTVMGMKDWSNYGAGFFKYLLILDGPQI